MPTDTDTTKEEKPSLAAAAAYTANHAIACTATDFIDPFVGYWTQRYLGKRVSIGCGHDHSAGDVPHEAPPAASPSPTPTHEHHAGCGHDHLFSVGSMKKARPSTSRFACVAESPTPVEAAPVVTAPARPHQGNSLARWWIGELAGDIGAVPLTVAAQYFAPGAMAHLGSAMEWGLGPVFRLGAERQARRWAERQGLPVHGPEAKCEAQRLYEAEITPLPKALLWTASSVAINLGTQRALGNTAPLWHLAAGKATGATISAGLLLSGRAMAPQAAQNWDRFTGDHLFRPLMPGKDDPPAQASSATSTSSWQR